MLEERSKGRLVIVVMKSLGIQITRKWFSIDALMTA